MPQEDLQKFIEAVRRDSSLQEKLRAEGADAVAIAKEAGFSITRAELIRDHASQIQDLNDEELEGVAGGYTGGMGVSVGIPVLFLVGPNPAKPLLPQGLFRGPGR